MLDRASTGAGPRAVRAGRCAAGMNPREPDRARSRGAALGRSAPPLRGGATRSKPSAWEPLWSLCSLWLSSGISSRSPARPCAGRSRPSARPTRGRSGCPGSRRRRRATSMTRWPRAARPARASSGIPDSTATPSAECRKRAASPASWIVHPEVDQVHQHLHVALRLQVAAHHAERQPRACRRASPWPGSACAAAACAAPSAFGWLGSSVKRLPRLCSRIPVSRGDDCPSRTARTATGSARPPGRSRRPR